MFCLQQAELPEDSDDEDPDEVFGFISIINLTDRKVKYSYDFISALYLLIYGWLFFTLLNIYVLVLCSGCSGIGMC